MRVSELRGILEPRTLVTPDGVRIRYFDSGAGSSNAIPLVLANGLGGPIGALHRPMVRLAPSRRVLSWDYRGLYGSSSPGRFLDVSVRAHARDLAAVLEDAGIEKAAVLGWSMGSQVGLELARLAPERLAGLVLLNGTAGRPLAGLRVPGAERLVPLALALLGRNPRAAGRILDAAARMDGLEGALKAVGWIQREFPSHDFQSFLEEFRQLDLPRYFQLFQALIAHDASDVLPSLKVPTLVLGSEHDFLTPPRDARRLANQIPGARYWIIPGASHYAAAEAPDCVAERVLEFLRESVDEEGVALSRASDHGYDAHVASGRSTSELEATRESHNGLANENHASPHPRHR